jgi:flagellar FliL protein
MAAAKSDSTPSVPAKADAAAAAAKGDAKGEAPVAVAAPVAAKPSALAAWLPVIAVILLAPVATWAAVEFVVLPRLQQKIATAPTAAETAAATEAAGAHGGKAGKEGKDGKDSGAATYEFQNVVVNLAGTMGTRYLKTTFLVTGVDANIKATFEGAKPRLTDVTLNVLSSLTLADLEEPGAKNVIREKLVAAYNQALGKKVADQVYFSDFVIQ